MGNTTSDFKSRRMVRDNNFVLGNVGIGLLVKAKAKMRTNPRFGPMLRVSTNAPDFTNQ